MRLFSLFGLFSLLSIEEPCSARVVMVAQCLTDLPLKFPGLSASGNFKKSLGKRSERIVHVDTWLGGGICAKKVGRVKHDRQLVCPFRMSAPAFFLFSQLDSKRP